LAFLGQIRAFRVRPRLLDLFCGAGGAAVGYHRAGFDVVGVDIEPQPRYPFEFHQADAMTFDLGGGWDAIHASPVCKGNTTLRALYPDRTYIDFLTPMRERLRSQPAPWVIENVPGAPMRADVVLCGTLFDLKVRRHRWFEFSTPPAHLLSPCWHRERAVGVYGHTGGTERRNPGLRRHDVEEWKEAMGIDWMTVDELAQAIPPAYTLWIGERLLESLGRPTRSGTC
jgi:DNA (cytosine-5)-methyltransferase 1